MEESLITYIDRLEVMAFFAGYPIVYAFTRVIVAMLQNKKVLPDNKLVSLLPFAYALSGILFVGFVLKNMLPGYSLKTFAEEFQYSYLKLLGLSAVVFWIPFFSKKIFLSLLHGLIFFSLLLKDIFIHFNSSSGKEILKNDMKVYTDSILLNTFTFAITVIVFYLYNKIKNHKKNQRIV